MKRGYSSAPQGSVSGGPLVTTSHLRDLDVELEMLKRKRLMIEQQQRMLSNERYDNQPSHNLPQYDQQQSFNQHQNFGQNHNNSLPYGNGSSGRFTGSQFGQSFQSVRPNWDFEPSNRYIPQSTDFTPNRNTFGPKPKNPKRNFAPKPKKFNQKPKYGSSNKPIKGGPNKTVKNNSTHSKDLVKEAASLATEMEQDKDFWVFKADKPPNAKIVAWMEHACGCLMKDVREHFTKNYADVLNNIPWPRAVKKELLIRIKSVLLGKTVPNVNGIVQLYRNQFPPDTDDALLELSKIKELVEKSGRSLPQKFLAKGSKKLIIETTDTFAGPKNHNSANESTVSDDNLNKKEASNESTGLIDTLNTSQQPENHDSSVNISDDLDENITDLLASVRQTDEAKNESNGDVEILSENTDKVTQEHVKTSGSEEPKLPDITEESADDTVTIESKEANTRIEEVADKNNTVKAAAK